MFRITLQDLRYRARQFSIAVIGAGLLFAMSILLAGMAAGFSVEITKTVDGMGADYWVLGQGAAGRIASLPAIPASTVAAVAREPGVRQAAPVLIVTMPILFDGKTTKTANLIGTQPGSALGGPGSLTSGHEITGPGQAVVDDGLGVGLGQNFIVADQTFHVVGITSERSLFGGVANAYVTLHNVQDTVFGGHPVIGAVLVTGDPSRVPGGYVLKTNAEISAASLQQMKAGVSSINSTRYFMWVIAAIIVAALVYVTALERTRDFAVLKAVGATTAVLFAGLAGQAVLVSLMAAIIGGVLSTFMTGIFPQPLYVPDSAYVILPLSALLVGLLASLAALRRAASVDPSAAFAGA
ncbi:MAG: ABC transporter permease [Acidimicrobiales bacterium]